MSFVFDISRVGCITKPLLMHINYTELNDLGEVGVMDMTHDFIHTSLYCRF